MNPEEYLDHLLESRARGEAQLSVTDDGIKASLASAEILTRLQEIAVPPEFASRVENTMRSRIRALPQHNGKIASLGGPRTPARSPRLLSRRVWIVELGIAAVLVLGYLGMLTAYTRSLPGDAIYGLKQAEQQVARTFASDPQYRASVQIDQLRTSLVDLSTVVNDGRRDDAIKLALLVVSAKTSDSLKAVAGLPAGTGREAAQQDLDDALAQEDQTLRHLLNQVDWPMRLAFTQQLGVLGDPVPTVTHVIVSIQGNGTLLITLTGTHFAPHAELIIDGRPGGTVSQITPQQLVAFISRAALSPGPHKLGVRNPDGTAAEIVFSGHLNGPYDE